MESGFRRNVNLLQLRRSLVYDEIGREIRLTSLWQRGPSVLVFLRHFACLACRAHVDQVWDKRELFRRAGAKLFFIGSGTPRFLHQFKAETGLTRANILTDPYLVSFEGAGMRRSLMASHGPTSLLNAAGLALKGYRQQIHKLGQGDTWQLGGVIVMGPRDRVKYQFVSQSTGDFPSVEEPYEAISITDHGKLKSLRTN